MEQGSSQKLQREKTKSTTTLEKLKDGYYKRNKRCRKRNGIRRGK